MDYLKSYFNKDLNEIGIKRFFICYVLFVSVVYIVISSHSINDTQQNLLKSVEMKRLFHCLELFVGWLQGGLYDFSSLPLSLFNHLKDGDMDIIMNAHTNYSRKLLFGYQKVAKQLYKVLVNSQIFHR